MSTYYIRSQLLFMSPSSVSLAWLTDCTRTTISLKKKTTAFTDRGWQSHIYNLFFNFIILDWIRQAACKSRLFLKRFRFSKLWEQRANEKNSWAVNSKFQIYLYNKIYLTETSRETERGIPSYLTEKITRSLYMMLKEPNEDNKYSVKY